ncbi:hypothetical protein [Roseivivax sp.]
MILWADYQTGRAVVWCDDQAELAFILPEPGAVLPEGEARLDAGDLIGFELEVRPDYRLVRNPKLLSRGTHETLAALLVRHAADGREPGPGLLGPFTGTELWVA